MHLPDGTIRHRRKALGIAGLAHELTFSCFRKLPLLSNDTTRRWLVEALECARQRHAFELWAWVAMLDHVHLLIFLGPQAETVSPILKSIKQSVSRRATRWFRRQDPELLASLRLRRGARFEHRFWQAGGGYDRDLISKRAVRGSIEYLHATPVRGGLVSDPTQWRWSSARWYCSSASAVDIEMDLPRIALS
jgi:putative transposase